LYTNRLVTLRLYAQESLALLGIDAPTLLRQEILGRQFLITTVARLLADFGSLLTTGFFVLVATVFLLLQTTHLAERLNREFGPDNPFQAQVIQATQRMARFFAIRVRVNLIVAAGITLWLVILGVDLAALWGILAFFLSFIMYVGLALAAIPPTLLALAESGPWWAFGVIIGVTVINVGVENVLAPAMMGQGLNLAPVVALASLVFWAWVLGPLGLLLAIPLTVILVMLLASNPETHWLTVLLTMDTPQATPLTSELGSAVDEPSAPSTQA
ncbi:MAG TPA: AI-2E family transporter, partial [Caldilineaceae bacterium]|nr:AI-2E family transporter [Caldilineaceae bacterium]